MPLADDKPTGQNIDQIRELIFGEQIRDYDRRFKDISHQFSKLEQAFHDDLEKKEADLVKKLDELKKSMQTLEKDMKKHLATIETDKADRLQLANLLIDMGMRLKGENILNSIDTDQAD